MRGTQRRRIQADLSGGCEAMGASGWMAGTPAGLVRPKEEPETRDHGNAAQTLHTLHNSTHEGPMEGRLDGEIRTYVDPRGAGPERAKPYTPYTTLHRGRVEWRGSRGKKEEASRVTRHASAEGEGMRET